MKNILLPAPASGAIANQSISSGNILIRVAETRTELEEIFRLRYKIYVEEMHLTQDYADHLNKMIAEPLDKGAINIGAWVNGRLAGCIRLTLGDRSDFGKYKDLLCMTSIENANLQLSVMCTKLMVAPSFRKSRINVLLQQFCYRIALNNNMQYCFIECQDHNLFYYQKFGFRSYMNRIVDIEYGGMNPLMLKIQDIDYLTSIRSPYAAIYHEARAFQALTTNAA